MNLNRTSSNWTELERNKINENWYRLEKLSKEINDLVLESGGDSNLEVVQARGGEPVLNVRLNKIDAQLAETKHQVNNLENTKMSIYEGATKSELNQKETEIKSYLDNQLSQIGNMTPKGAFATLQDLENAYPNGSEGVFIVQENGHWYYWGGSEWVDGGEYQAQPWDEFMTEQDEEWVI